MAIRCCYRKGGVFALYEAIEADGRHSLEVCFELFVPSCLHGHPAQWSESELAWSSE